jgi:hypothetical protein
MLKILATLRRLFLAGTISLIIIFVLFVKEYSFELKFPYSDIFAAFYLYFALFSPILAILFWLISSIYIRKKGQSAAYQSQRKFIGTMGTVFISDITSPFRIIIEQFTSKKKLRDYYGQVVDDGIAGMLAEGSKSINRGKLLRMLIRFCVYAVGIMTSSSLIAKL